MPPGEDLGDIGPAPPDARLIYSVFFGRGPLSESERDFLARPPQQPPKAPRRQYKPRRPNISKMIEEAEKAGKPLASITMPDGTKLDFSKAEQRGNEFDEWIAKHADKTQGH